MANKHILSKTIITGLLGAAFFPITPDAEATFIGDEVIVTWDIAGSVASETYIAVGDPRAILNYPDDFSPTTAPISGAHTYVLMPDSSLDVVYNLGIFDITSPIDVTLTVSDIDWLDTEPMEIVGVSDTFFSWGAPTSITTGADFFSLYWAVTEGSLDNSGYFDSYGGFNLVFEPAAPVPEPATVTLMGIGLGYLALTRKLKNRKL